MTEGQDAGLRGLDVLLGEWDIEATHPMVPGVIVRGTTTFEWMDGRRFVLMKTWNDHPDFPNSTSVIGDVSMDRVDDKHEGPDRSLRMFYFDSRGVHRVYDFQVTAETWTWWRDSEGFSQRFIGTFEDGGDRIVSRGEMCRDGETWEPDLQVIYHRKA